MARSKKAKQWTGVLADPIDPIVVLGLIMPIQYPVNSPEFQKWCDDHYDRMWAVQIAMMPELARQLGMQVDKFDLTTEHGLMMFYRQLALNLALKLEIPGFMEAKHKWDPAIVHLALQDGQARRKRGEPDPELNACLMVVQGLDKNLRRKGQKQEAIKRAKTLRNEVYKLRQKMAAKVFIDEAIEFYHKNKPVIS